MSSGPGSCKVQNVQLDGRWLWDHNTLTFISDGSKAASVTIPQEDLIVVLDQHDPATKESLVAYVKLSGDAADHTEIATLRARGLPEDLLSAFSPRKNDILGLETTAPLSKPRLTVIVSLGSGTKKAEAYFKDILGPFLDGIGLAGRYEAHYTSTAESITAITSGDIARYANGGEAQTIILLSGDGGPVDLVNALWKHKKSEKYLAPTLVALPFGTGNALSNSYGYNSDCTNGLSTLFRGSTRRLPSFTVCFSTGARAVVDEGRGEEALEEINAKPGLHGLVVCSWGLHSTLVADSDTEYYRQFGAERFGMVAKRLLHPEDGSQHHAYTGKVSLQSSDGNWHSLSRSEHSYILATLVSNLEKTFCISPDSKSLDGKLRLIDLPSMTGANLMEIMMAGYQDGKHIGMQDVGYHEIQALRVEFFEPDGRWRRVCVDGKIVRVEQGGFLELTLDTEDVVDIVSLVSSPTAVP